MIDHVNCKFAVDERVTEGEAAARRDHWLCGYKIPCPDGFRIRLGPSIGPNSRIQSTEGSEFYMLGVFEIEDHDSRQLYVHMTRMTRRSTRMRVVRDSE